MSKCVHSHPAVPYYKLKIFIFPTGTGVSLANETLSHNVGVFACVCLASRLVVYGSVAAFSLTGIALFSTRKVGFCLFIF